jgi:hypothetical protein
MEQVFLSLGINGVITFILYFYIKNSFDHYKAERESNKESMFHERRSNKENIDNLCLRIDKLVDVMHDEIAHNTQLNVNRVNDMEVLKDQYIRMANKVESIREDVRLIQERQLQIQDVVQGCRNHKKEE